MAKEVSKFASKDPEKRAKQLANLKPVKGKEEAKKRGKNGGLKNGETQRRKKELRDIAIEMMELSLKDGKLDNLTSMNVKGKNITVKEALIFAQFKKAMEGDESALKLVLQFVGDKLLQVQENPPGTPESTDNGFINALNGVSEKVWDDEEKD